MEGTIEEAQFEADQEQDEALKSEKAAEVASKKAELDELLAGFEARAPAERSLGRHAFVLSESYFYLSGTDS